MSAVMIELARFVFHLVTPFTLGLLLGALALVFGVTRWPRAALWTGLAGLILAWGGAMPWVADALAGPLESRHEALAATQAPVADAIVVLGGALGAGRTPGQSFDLGPAADRVWHAAALYRAGKAAVVIVAAGPRHPGSREWVEADGIREMLQRLGVPSPSILDDRLSSDTRANAQQAGILVQRVGARRVLLVTSAMHMPRAVATFERAWRGRGVEIVPAPTDFEAGDGELRLPWSLMPMPAAAVRTHLALKEHAGLLALDIMP